MSETKSVDTELMLVQTVAAKIADIPTVIKTEEEAFEVTDALLAVRKLFNEAEAKRKHYTSPANETIKLINVDFKPITGQLKEWEVQLGALLDVYADVRVEDDEIKQEKMRGDTGDQSLVIPIGVKTLPSVAGEIRFRQAFDVEVHNVDEVPKEYLVVDTKAVEKAIKAADGKIQIPGIAFRASHSHAIYLK